MSVKFHGIVRTVRIIRPYKVEQHNGRNGAFESRMVMFTVASDREYRQAVTNADGTVSQERHTDFFACRATGPIADLFNRYCSATKVDANGNQKLASRRLNIEGHLEKYNATRTEQVQLPDGRIIQVALPEERTILVIESIDFLDANPIRNNNGTTAQATVMAQPIANAGVQQVQAVAPVMNAVPQVAQPVMNAVPQAQVVAAAPQVAQPVVAQPIAQPVVAQEAIPTTPVVTGDVNAEVAPF